MKGRWRAMLLGVATIAGASLALAAPPSYRNTGYCFGPDDGAAARFRIFRYPSRPPLSNADVGFKYYPLTDSSGTAVSAVDAGSATNIRRNWFLWANLCNFSAGLNSCHRFPPRPDGRRGFGEANPPPRPMIEDPSTHQDFLFAFASYNAANSCTMIQAAYALGYSNAKLAQLAVGTGLTVVDRARVPTMMDHDAADIFHDVCVLPDARLSSAVKGVMLDYEVHDARTPRIARDFLVAFAALVHGAAREAILYTNPLDASGQRLSALDRSNLNDIQAAFDITTILLLRKDQATDFAREYAFQRGLLEGPRPVKPPLITFDLARSTLADAAVTRAIILRDHLPGVIVFQKTAQLEGPCDTDANRKLACFVYG
ncbi:MAG: hypothetical protein ABI056_02445, partial [Caulobacteraceae bacterium]